MSSSWVFSLVTIRRVCIRNKLWLEQIHVNSSPARGAAGNSEETLSFGWQVPTLHATLKAFIVLQTRFSESTGSKKKVSSRVGVSALPAYLMKDYPSIFPKSTTHAFSVQSPRYLLKVTHTLFYSHCKSSIKSKPKLFNNFSIFSHGNWITVLYIYSVLREFRANKIGSFAIYSMNKPLIDEELLDLAMLLSFI